MIGYSLEESILKLSREIQNTGEESKDPTGKLNIGSNEGRAMPVPKLFLLLFQFYNVKHALHYLYVKFPLHLLSSSDVKHSLHLSSGYNVKFSLHPLIHSM